MNILIFDTETIGVEKCYCYNLGYRIINLDTRAILCEKDFVIKQVWENKMLFETAYYHNKKPMYVSALRGRNAKIINYGFAMREMIKDIEKFNIENAFAYNSNFDTKVFDFNCDWYKCSNALDYVRVYDIWGFTSELIASGKAQAYIDFCVANGFISEANNLKNNADTWGKFLLGLDFEEKHTALADSQIECDILLYCLQFLPIADYKVRKCISAPTQAHKTLSIIDSETGEVLFKCDYANKTDKKTKGELWLSGARVKVASMGI